MINKRFRYEIPTIIQYGNKEIEKIGDHIKFFDGENVLIVCDPGVLKAGVIKKVEEPLRNATIPFTVFSEIEGEADIDAVEKGKKIGADQGCNIVIGVGGGSALDTAKAIGLMLNNSGDIREYVGIDLVPNPGVPVIAVPTTAGTGSEITIWSVLSDKKNNTKLSVGSVYNCPNMALIDPDLTISLPPHITAATGMDALTHALESYVNKATQPISEGLSLQAMKMISENLRLAVVQGENVEARSNMILASSIAAMAFNSTRLGLAHALAIPLGAHFKIPHGTVNAILLPEVMRFNVIGNPKKFAEIAQIFGVSTTGLTERESAEKSVEAIRQLKEDVGINQSLSDYGVEEKDLDFIAEEAMKSGNVPVNPRKPTLEDLKRICQASMQTTKETITM